MPPISSPPPARPGPPWMSPGQRRAMSGRLLGAIAIDDQQPAMERREAEREFHGGIVVGRED